MANEGSKPAKAAFIAAVRFTLKSGATRQARGLFEQVRQLHTSTKSGWHYWTYYTQLGPAESYVILAPGHDLKTFDSAPAGGALASVTPTGAADTLLTELESTFHQQERALLEYYPDFSNHPSKDGNAPGPLVFHTRLSIRAGSAAAVKAGLKKLVGNHVAANDGGKRFWTYGTLAGGDERALHILMPFDHYAQLKTTSDNTNVASIHETDLTEIDSHIHSIERTVLEYLPAFSHPPA